MTLSYSLGTIPGGRHCVLGVGEDGSRSVHFIGSESECEETRKILAGEITSEAELVKPAKPARPRRPVARRNCCECSATFETNRSDREFCSSNCKAAWNNRRMTRGARLYDLAMDFRGRRKKGGFTEVCRMIDSFLEEDRDANRKTYHKNPSAKRKAAF